MSSSAPFGRSALRHAGRLRSRRANPEGPTGLPEMPANREAII